jgi:uncharacterized protein
MRHSIFIIILCILNINVATASKVAIIGGGAAGTTTALLTQDTHEVTLYEADSTLGGHAKTHTINTQGEVAVIEAGTEFFNRPAYPNFLKLLTYLGITVSAFTLTFNFYRPNQNKHLVMPPVHDGNIEWNTFRPSNLLKLIQLRWVLYHAQSIVKNKQFDITLKTFLDSFYLITPDFKNNFIYPLLGSAWGVPPNDIKDFSAYITLKYLVDGHNADNQWLEIDQGMSKYIENLQDKLDNTNIEFNTPIKQVTKEGDQYRVVKKNGDSDLFDHVVFGVNPRLVHSLTKKMAETTALNEQLAKVRTYQSKLDLCRADGEKNLRFKPDRRQVVNIRWDGQDTSVTFCKKWKASAHIPEILRVWLTYDVRNKDNANSLFDDPITYKFEHLFLNKHYYTAYHAAKSEEGKNGLWFPGIHDDDSHESAITAAIDVATKLTAPDNPKLRIFK